MELTSVAVAPRGSIDDIDFVDGLPNLVRHAAPWVVAAGAPVRLRGWALDAGRLVLGTELAVELGTNRVEATFADDRPDIAVAFGSPALAGCGFTIGVPTRGLPPGSHDLQAWIRFPDDKTWYSFAATTVHIAARSEDTAPLAPEAVAKGRVELRGSIDSIQDFGRRRMARPGENFSVIAGSALIVRGWAYHPLETIKRVRLRLGTRIVVPGFLGYPREDIAKVLGRTDASASGFAIPLQLGALPTGRHSVAVECETDAGWISLAGDNAIVVIPPHEEFPVGARLLIEVLPAAIVSPPSAFEAAETFHIAGTIEASNLSGAYLEVHECKDFAGVEDVPRYYPLDYPLAEAGGTGFSLELAGKAFARGTYAAWIVATSPDRRAYRASAQRIRFDVIAPRARQR